MSDQQRVSESTTIDLARVLRLRAMLESLRNEVRDLAADDASLGRLAQVHNLIQDELGSAVSDDLEDELAEFSTCCHGNPNPSKPEIRVAQAQLLGWIEGLLKGVQVSLAGAAPQPQPQTPPIASGSDDGESFSKNAYL